MVDRAYNIVYIHLSNNRVDVSVETCSGLSITEAEKKIVDFAEDAIQRIKDPVAKTTTTITKHSVTIETEDYGKTTTIVYAVVDAH